MVCVAALCCCDLRLRGIRPARAPGRARRGRGRRRCARPAGACRGRPCGRSRARHCAASPAPAPARRARWRSAPSLARSAPRSVLGSMRAITWPFLTWSLKSTSTSVTCPRSGCRRSTVEIALSVPVAEIADADVAALDRRGAIAPSSAARVALRPVPRTAEQQRRDDDNGGDAPVCAGGVAGRRSACGLCSCGPAACKESRQANAPVRACVDNASADVRPVCQ